jgi:hypothetical protein
VKASDPTGSIVKGLFEEGDPAPLGAVKLSLRRVAQDDASRLSKQTPDRVLDFFEPIGVDENLRAGVDIHLRLLRFRVKGSMESLPSVVRPQASQATSSPRARMDLTSDAVTRRTS